MTPPPPLMLIILSNHNFSSAHTPLHLSTIYQVISSSYYIQIELILVIFEPLYMGQTKQKYRILRICMNLQLEMCCSKVFGTQSNTKYCSLHIILNNIIYGECLGQAACILLMLKIMQ